MSMDTEEIYQNISGYVEARRRGAVFDGDADYHMAEIKRLLKEAEDERAELVKAHDELLDKLKAKADLLRGCYAADHKRQKRVAELESALSMSRDALAGGLWDYGPGQDEHDKCNEVIAAIDAALKEDKT